MPIFESEVLLDREQSMRLKPVLHSKQEVNPLQQDQENSENHQLKLSTAIALIQEVSEVEQSEQSKGAYKGEAAEEDIHDAEDRVLQFVLAGGDHLAYKVNHHSEGNSGVEEQHEEQRQEDHFPGALPVVLEAHEDHQDLDVVENGLQSDFRL